MQAYNGSATLKKDLLAEARKHEDLDEIIQGTYGDENGWCAVGCTIQSYNDRRGKTFNTSDHSVYEKELGIPRIIARLEDRLFEGMKLKDAKGFPVKFLNAITPGADLSMVWSKFIIWLLADETDGVIKFARTERTKKSIETVVKLYKRRLNGDEPSSEEWCAAADAADAAAAAYAAYAAVYADAAARRNHYKKMADKLLSLLVEAE